MKSSIMGSEVSFRNLKTLQHSVENPDIYRATPMQCTGWSIPFGRRKQFVDIQLKVLSQYKLIILKRNSNCNVNKSMTSTRWATMYSMRLDSVPCSCWGYSRSGRGRRRCLPRSRRVRRRSARTRGSAREADWRRKNPGNGSTSFRVLTYRVSHPIIHRDFSA